MRAGPQARSPKCPTCPSVPAFHARFVSKAHLPTSAPFRARVARPGIRASYTKATREEVPALRPRFPAAFRPPGIRFIGTLSRHGNSAPLTVGLPHRLRIPAPGIRTHSRVSTFRTRETRTGPAALYTPGTAVSTRPGSIPGRRLPHLSGMSLSSRQNHPAQDVRVTRHQQGFPGSRPSGPFPSPVAAMAGAAALGLFRELRTRPVRNRPRTSRRGQVEHHLLLCLRHQPDLLDQHTHHVRPRVATLTTCDLVSQCRFIPALSHHPRD